MQVASIACPTPAPLAGADDDARVRRLLLRSHALFAACVLLASTLALAARVAVGAEAARTLGPISGGVLLLVVVLAPLLPRRRGLPAAALAIVVVTGAAAAGALSSAWWPGVGAALVAGALGGEAVALAARAFGRPRLGALLGAFLGPVAVGLVAYVWDTGRFAPSITGLSVGGVLSVVLYAHARYAEPVLAFRHGADDVVDAALSRFVEGARSAWLLALGVPATATLELAAPEANDAR